MSATNVIDIKDEQISTEVITQKSKCEKECKGSNILDIFSHKIHNQSEKLSDHWRAILAEFIGTTIFIYIGMATSIGSLLDKSRSTGLLEGALSAGGALTILIFALGHVSGGHLNPAVTLSIMLVRAMSVKLGLMYWVAQILGSFAATGLFMASLPSGNIEISQSFLGLAPTISIGNAIIVQILVTGLLCLVVLATAVDSKGGESRNTLCPIPIGMAVGIGILVAGPLIGGSMNPSGSIGAIVIYGQWGWSWLYIVGPLIGSFIFSVTFKGMFMTRSTGVSSFKNINKSLEMNM